MTPAQFSSDWLQEKDMWWEPGSHGTAGQRCQDRDGIVHGSLRKSNIRRQVYMGNSPHRLQENIFPHRSACVFASTRAFRGLLQRSFCSVKGSFPAGQERRGRCSWRPAESLSALPVVAFSSIPTLRETFLPFTFYRRGNLGAWNLTWARPSQLLSNRLRNQTWV